MQIFKCLNTSYRRKKGQNLVEFVLVFPMIILMTLCIFEIAFFWQDVNMIYSINTQINARAALVSPREMSAGDVCPAAQTAVELMHAKTPMEALVKPQFKKTILDGAKMPKTDSTTGTNTITNEPFALYKYTSTATVTTKDGTQPVATLWVDCRNPFEDGIITQIQFYHKTMIMHASLPNFKDNTPIDIIPENILITSPKLNTLSHY
ncbi:pilus assembly protein [bacterium]|jgi:Flp pilus assembly protein TadG|nr:pilus assembly protein [bacterium]